jgi:cell division protein FtsB
VIVRGPWKTKVAPAANLLAQQLLKVTGRYQIGRLKQMQKQVSLEQHQLDVLAQRNTVAVDNYKAISGASGLSATEKALALNSASGLLNTIETRQSTLQAQHTEDIQTVLQIQNIEMPTVVTRAVATQTTAASKRAGYAVAIILGLIVGVLLALISYAAWPVKPRDETA